MDPAYNSEIVRETFGVSINSQNRNCNYKIKKSYELTISALMTMAIIQQHCHTHNIKVFSAI